MHRRRLIKALTIGGGAVTAARLPMQWSTPVVDSVLLPAHAQTTSVTPLSGSSIIEEVANSDNGSRFRTFAQRPLLDGLLSVAHAMEPPPNGGQPSSESSRLFAYAERDVAQVDGWWRVQVLLTIELVSMERFLLNEPRSITESFIAPAHAVESEPELCIFERIYETLLQVQGGANGFGNAAASDGCGTFPDASEAVLLQLVNFDDPNNATSGIVRADLAPGPVVDIPVTPGGAPLFVNCGADACDIVVD